jgi:hypothetical protein
VRLRRGWRSREQVAPRHRVQRGGGLIQISSAGRGAKARTSATRWRSPVTARQRLACIDVPALELLVDKGLVPAG